MKKIISIIALCLMLALSGGTSTIYAEEPTKKEQVITKADELKMVEAFTKEMNEFCLSLGDCGAYINYVGEATQTGYTVSASRSTPPRTSAPTAGSAPPR